MRDLLKTVEHREIQDMVRHMLKAEDLVRGAFPKISLEVLLIRSLQPRPQGRHARGADSRHRAGTPNNKACGPAAKPGATKPRETAEPIRPDASGKPFRRRSPESMRRASMIWRIWMTGPPMEDLPVRTIPSSPAAADGAPARAGDFAAYLKEQSTMLFGMWAAFDARVRGGQPGDHPRQTVESR